MSTTQRVLGFVAGLAAVFAVGLGLGQLVDLEEPAPVRQTPSHTPNQAPSEQPSHAPSDHDEREVP
ncbi:hypothetical protein NSZ01_13640 [Nocardioides szechwanensis]|uniref:Uncharacterized protein n=1 Tax=Nocardioides szechwanensis TaxID=1005944 RepID=A0A1H0BWB1_9ACTN|nr:hypothetical protein [Nocardioides szechwanensis]GEP33596.1 hypothetical protein NSZ01_13640 [Nocardioides szechwanensis]SDN49959.1 hypothetical protein SAMN05192576_2252 [Nocardioides szechwanensis]